MRYNLLRSIAVASAIYSATFASNAAPLNQQDVPVIYGSVVMTANSELPEGIYRIPLSATDQWILVAPDAAATAGGVGYKERYYCVKGADYSSDGALSSVETYDATTWKQLSTEIIDPTLRATDLAVDPLTGKIYGCFADDDFVSGSYVFGRVRYDAGFRWEIERLEKAWNACAIDASGQVWAIDIDGTLLAVDKESGAIEEIGQTGIKPTYSGSAVIDPRTNRFFWSDGSGNIYEVDTNTATASRIITYPAGERITGLYIPPFTPADKAPADITDLTLDFPGGQLSGSIRFTLPTEAFDESMLAATSPLTYSIRVNANEIHSGEGLPGSKVDEEVTFPTRGTRHISIITSNEAGESNEATISSYFGTDIPETPQVNATWDGDKVTISWQPVINGANGGFIDPATITYSVKRMPDDQTVIGSTTETTITDNTIDTSGAPHTVYYIVRAYSGNLSSEPGESPVIPIGAVDVPWNEDFIDSSSQDAFTVINSNLDSEKWKYATGSWGCGFQIWYNSNKDADDWLITPAINLRGGNRYRFTLKARTAPSDEERFEVRVGTNKTPDAMTGEVIPATNLRHNDLRPYSGSFSIDESGIYYIGVHAISPKDRNVLSVTDFELILEASELSPDKAINLEAKADITRPGTAIITFDAPVATTAGKPLTRLSRIELSRDGELINTFNDIEAGASCSYEDTGLDEGVHTYTVIAYNSEEPGMPAEAKVFIGINTPGNPTDFTVKETDKLGEVHLSWNPPATDADGYPIDPSLVTYTIVAPNADGQAVAIAERIPDLSYTYQAVDPSTQEMVYYGIFAYTSTGRSSGVVSPMIPVGKPDPLPYRLSFGSSTADVLSGKAIVTGSTNWEICNDSEYLDLQSQDNDNGFLIYQGKATGDAAELFTGKIAIPESTHTALSFWIYNQGMIEEENDLSILDITINDGDGFKDLQTLVVSEAAQMQGWNRIMMSLDEFAGKTIQIKFTGIIVNFAYIILDNISVAESAANDLMAGSLSAPAAVMAGKDFSMSFTYSNNGTTTAEDYTLDLYRENELVQSIPGEPIASGTAASVEFNVTIGVNEPEGNHCYHASVNLPSDENTDNNSTEPVTIKLDFPSYPYVTDLTATIENGNALLRWNAPDINGISAYDEITEDFEGYDSWANNNVGDWKFIDADGRAIGGFGEINMPGIERGSKQSFWIMDGTDPTFGGATTWMGHDGSAKYLAQSWLSDQTACDDWAISPRLSPDRQTISFYARSLAIATSELETFQILYSASEDQTDTSAFVLLEQHNDIPHDWTLFSAEIPAEANYFAIRCISTNCYMLYIDDVTFTPKDGGQPYEIDGYHIYRDNTRLTNVPVTTTSWTDRDLPITGVHTYAVSTVYAGRGESRLSNIVTLQMSGIEPVAQTTADISVTASGNTITVTGAEGLTVTACTPSGATIFSTDSAPSELTFLSPTGIIIIKAGTTVVPLIVR